MVVDDDETRFGGEAHRHCCPAAVPFHVDVECGAPSSERWLQLSQCFEAKRRGPIGRTAVQSTAHAEWKGVFDDCEADEGPVQLRRGPQCDLEARVVLSTVGGPEEVQHMVPLVAAWCWQHSHCSVLRAEALTQCLRELDLLRHLCVAGWMRDRCGMSSRYPIICWHHQVLDDDQDKGI
jgi:hypothetical protein